MIFLGYKYAQSWWTYFKVYTVASNLCFQLMFPTKQYIFEGWLYPKWSWLRDPWNSLSGVTRNLLVDPPVSVVDIGGTFLLAVSLLRKKWLKLVRTFGLSFYCTWMCDPCRISHAFTLRSAPVILGQYPTNRDRHLCWTVPHVAAFTVWLWSRPIHKYPQNL